MPSRAICAVPTRTIAASRLPADHGRQQAVVGRQEHMSAGRDSDDVARSADARIDDRDVHRAGREIAEGARQPEPRLGRPVHDDLVREIDDAAPAGWRLRITPFMTPTNGP